MSLQSQGSGRASLVAWGLALLLAICAGAGNAATVQYVYDEIGRLIAVIDPATDVTEYRYDDVGNLLSVARRSSAQVSIVSFAPTRGDFGETVTIVGTGFSTMAAQNQVRFNGTPATIASATSTSLVTSVPLGATTGPITVMTPTGTATSAVAFVVREAPHIASFSPAIGQPDGNLTITGRGFNHPLSNISVIVNKSVSQVISATADTLTSRIPTATGGKISVTTPLGTATTTDDFFIVPAPHTAADVAATERVAINGPGRVLALPAGKIGLALFEGTAGNFGIQISLSSVTLAGGTLTVFRPDGTPLVSGITFGTAGLNLRLPSLPVTGTYGVLVVPNAGAGGNVTLAASTNAANFLSPGDTIVVSVAAGQSGSFTISGTAGDNLGLELKGVTMPSGGSYSVLAPGGGGFAGGIFAANSDFSVRLPVLTQTGVYTVIVSPFGGAAGSVQFTLWKDLDAGTLVLDVPKTVSTVFRNQQTRVTFSGTAGDNLGLELKGVTMPSGGVYDVLRPDGASIFQGLFAPTTDVSQRLPVLPSSGTYTVIVSPFGGATGSVQFTLWKELDAGTLVLDVPKTVSTVFRSQRTRVTFSGTAGEQLGLDVRSVTLPAGSSFVVVRPDNGQELFSFPVSPTSDFSFRMPVLPATGTYTIFIVPAANTTGSIQFTLWKDVNAGTLELNTPKTVTTSVRNQLARLTFSGTAGEQLGLEVKNVTMPSGGVFRLFAPDGTAILGTSFVLGSDFSNRLPVLPTTGTYTVEVTPAANTTGSIQFTLWKEVGASLTVDTPYPLTIQYRNQQARLTFSGTVGQNLGLDVTASTLPSGTVLRVAQPDGVNVVGISFSPGLEPGIRIPTLTQAGTYTVQIEPPPNGAGSVKLTLWNGEDVIGTLTQDTQVTTTITSHNQQARLTFSGTVGQNLGLDVTASTLPSGTVLRVAQPDGVNVVGISFSPGLEPGIRIPTLTQAGTYTVQIVPPANGAGSVKLTLWKDVTSALTTGTALSLTIQYRNQQARLTFDGTAGQNLGINLSGVTLPTGGTVSVLRPDGAIVLNTAFGTAGINVNIPTLTSTGVHTVHIVPNGLGTGNVTVNVFNQ